ncbi:hypothetical protein WMZ97_16655 [Lentibacillus sp. N15]|uniref:type II secretion system F family protein n=1 Tax=Lentibacillus songyuanensis TaxID=3136161 RepID=UPI0031BB5101
MMEFLTEKSRDVYLDYYRISNKAFIKRRILTTLVMIILSILLLMLYFNVWVVVVAPFIVIFGYKLPYLELIRMKSRDDLIKQHMFPMFLRYFVALIGTQGNVYQTLKATIPYMEDPLRSELIELVKKMDAVNVQDYDAFVEFGDFIGSPEAHMIMNMIHQFNEEGINKDDLKELERTVKELQENKMNEIIEYKAMAVDKHANPVLLYAIGYIISFTVILFVAYFKELPL